MYISRRRKVDFMGTDFDRPSILSIFPTFRIFSMESFLWAENLFSFFLLSKEVTIKRSAITRDVVRAGFFFGVMGNHI